MSSLDREKKALQAQLRELKAELKDIRERVASPFSRAQTSRRLDWSAPSPRVPSSPKRVCARELTHLQQRLSSLRRPQDRCDASAQTEQRQSAHRQTETERCSRGVQTEDEVDPALQRQVSQLVLENAVLRSLLPRSATRKPARKKRARKTK